MQPARVSIETVYDPNINTPVNMANLKLVPDKGYGFEFNPLQGISSELRILHHVVETPMTPGDAQKYISSKSKRTKEQILETYVISPDSEPRCHYFPMGARVGNIRVLSLLEVELPSEIES